MTSRDDTCRAKKSFQELWRPPEKNWNEGTNNIPQKSRHTSSPKIGNPETKVETPE